MHKGTPPAWVKMKRGNNRAACALFVFSATFRESTAIPLSGEHAMCYKFPDPELKRRIKLKNVCFVYTRSVMTITAERVKKGYDSFMKTNVGDAKFNGGNAACHESRL